MSPLLIDSDALLFTVLSATQHEQMVNDEGDTILASDICEARESYWGQVREWQNQFRVTKDETFHLFSDKSLWRRSIYPDYKKSRAGLRKPLCYSDLKREILTENNAFCYSQIEADDLIGIFATIDLDEVSIIASVDKDLNQIPGWHVWIGKEPTLISNAEAERFTYQQYLQGDHTDGIPGCPGIGPKRAAEKVATFDLSDEVGCWEEIVRTYEKAKVDLPEEFALLQARLVRIMRWGEYNTTTHQVIPWNPPVLTHPTKQSAASVKS